jgi:hypothetical protein
VKITEIPSTNNWAAFSKVKVLYSFSQEMSWATFWATFSQTHLVTLPQIIKPAVSG